MVGIVVISHGKMCEGIVDSLSMVAGNVDQLEVVSLKPGMTPDGYMEMLKTAVNKVNTGTGAVVFTDILGGTPFNTAIQLTREEDLGIVTGMNLPMLIEVVLNREET